MAAQERRNPDKYLPVLKDVAERRARLFGPNHKLTLYAQVALATGLDQAGHPREAKRLFEKLLPEFDQHVGPANFERLQAMRILAEECHLLGEPERGEALFSELLRIESDPNGKAAFTLPDTLDCMARIRQDAGDLEAAIELRRRAVRESEGRVGSHELNTLKFREKLGRLLLDAERFDEGLDELRQTVTTARAHLGPKHVRTFWFVNSLGQGLNLAKRYDEAIAVYEESLRLLAETLGQQNPLTIGTRGNIALNHWAAGRRELSIQMSEALLSEVHPTTVAVANELAILRSNLASDYSKLKRFSDALSLMQAVIQDREAQLGPAHKATIEARLRMGNLLLEQGNVQAALEQFRNCDELGGDGPEFIRDRMRIRKQLALALKRQGLADESLKLLDDTLAEAQTALPTNPQLLNFIDFVADECFAQHREQRGLELLRQTVARTASAPHLSQEARWTLPRTFNLLDPARCSTWGSAWGSTGRSYASGWTSACGPGEPSLWASRASPATGILAGICTTK